MIPHIPDRTRDDARLGALGLPGGAREVTDGNLADADPAVTEGDEKLGREEGAVRADPLERNAREHVAAKELERAVDVAPSSAEQQPDEPVVDPRDEQAAWRIGALGAVSDDDLGPIGDREELAEIGEIKLSVPVRVEDPVLPRRDEPRADRPAVPASPLVVDHQHARILCRQLVGDRAGPIGASVVHDGHDDVLGEAGEDGQGVRDGGAHVILFVECGKEEGEAREPFGHRRESVAVACSGRHALR